jgi:type I restriction enzyme S subunit
MEFELLGNICEVVRGSSPRPQGDKRYYGGNIPRLMIADVTRDKKYVTPIIDSLTEEGAAKSRPMKKGDLIIAVSGDPGRVCFLNVDACIHDGFVGLRKLDESKYDKEFLYYYLTFFKSSMKHRAYGAIFQNITTDILKGIKIPKLSISAQNNIAKLASKAENLIAQRKESIRLLDELLKSTFLEMFGDPVRNEKGWEVEQLGKVTFMKAGQFVAASDIQSEFSEGLYSCYGGNGLRGHVKTYTHEGDFVLIGRQGALCGNVKIAKGQFHATEHAVVCSPKMQFETYWLYYLLDIINLNKYASGAAQPGLAVGRLEQIEIIYPPIELQTQFAQIVEKTEALKTQYQQSLQELENLYGSLSQKAFRGELSISKNQKAVQI